MQTTQSLSHKPRMYRVFAVFRLKNLAYGTDSQTAKTRTSEAAIFARVFANGKQALTPELSRHVLGLSFSDDDKARMHELAVKHQEGRITREELQELDNYIKVGDLLAVLQSKARKSLKAKTK